MHENKSETFGKFRSEHQTTLSLTQDQARELFIVGVRSRDGLRQAISTGNMGEIGVYFGWLDAVLTEVVKACPSNIKPQTRGGGGEKPDAPK